LLLSRNLESTCNRVNCSRTANVSRPPTNRTTAHSNPTSLFSRLSILHLHLGNDLGYLTGASICHTDFLTQPLVNTVHYIKGHSLAYAKNHCSANRCTRFQPFTTTLRIRFLSRIILSSISVFPLEDCVDEKREILPQEETLL
jgi:hypothetical protein